MPCFEQMVSMIPDGKSRPNIAEYPEVEENRHQDIQQVYNGSTTPEEALDIALLPSLPLH
jgi:maltose-binding protein MalE